MPDMVRRRSGGSGFWKRRSGSPVWLSRQGQGGAEQAIIACVGCSRKKGPRKARNRSLQDWERNSRGLAAAAAAAPAVQLGIFSHRVVFPALFRFALMAGVVRFALMAGVVFEKNIIGWLVAESWC